MNTASESKGSAHHCWPRTLRLRRDVRTVYLDLNHWIVLAKAYSGHKDGRLFRDILDRLVQTVECGQAVFPISLAIYIELLKIHNHRRRSDLRKVIEHLGRFAVVTSRHIIAIHEIEALFDDLHGPNPDPVNTMDYLDWGVFRAMGVHGAPMVVNRDREDITSAARQCFSGGPDEFDRIINKCSLELNRQILDGPSTDEDELDLRAKGYRPELILDPFSKEAEAENALARLLTSTVGGPVDFKRLDK